MAALGTPIAAVSLNYFARLYICVQPGFLHGLFVQPLFSTKYISDWSHPERHGS